MNSTLFRIGFIANDILIQQIFFVLILFKMAASQTECSRLEQRSVINSLVAEMCKPCEI